MQNASRYFSGKAKIRKLGKGQNALKLTYNIFSFKNFPGGDTPGPPLKGGKEEMYGGEGKDRREVVSWLSGDGPF